MMKTTTVQKHNSSALHKVREVAGASLVGSVIAGAFLGWIDMSVDVRAVGACLGAAAGMIGAFASHLA